MAAISGVANKGGGASASVAIGLLLG